MKTELVALYRLQQLDSTLDRLKREFAALDPGRQEKEDYEVARTSVATATEDLHQKEVALRDNELEYQTVTAKRDEYEKKLYSGKITNPKELIAMQDEIAMLDRQRGRLEERRRELQAALEASHAAAEQAKRALESARRALQARQKTYKQVAGQIAAQARTLAAQRAQMAREIPEALLKRYETLRPARGGVAIVALQDGDACGGCKMGLPRMLVQRVREGTTIEVCTNCKRILCEAPVPET